MAAAETRLKNISAQKKFPHAHPYFIKKNILKTILQKTQSPRAKREIGKNLYQFPKSRRAD